MSTPPRVPTFDFGGEPVIKIQRCGTRESGLMAWKVWVEIGCMAYQSEFGSYAWTRKGAERKGRALLRHYLRTVPGPEIEVEA